MADLTNLPERGVPGTHLSVRHAPDAIAALRASIARQNLTIGVDAVTGDVTLYLNSAKTTYITFSTATGATQLVVLGVDRGSLEGGALGDKDFQESVLDLYDPTPNLPVTPTEGDRYIATATANGWTDTYIYTCNSLGAWDELIPTEGATVEVEDENVYYSFNGTAWVRLETLIAHNLLASLQGGTAAEYYHLTAAQHAALTVVAMEGVLDRFDPTAATPAGPSDWDAYIATATANGWTINNCYVWDGSAWQEVVSTEGLSVFVADEDLIYVFDGAAWGVLQAMGAGAHAHGAATGAGASHTHPITGPSGAGAAHTHAVTDPNHDHGAVTGAGGAHTHVFAGTALPTTDAKVEDNAGVVAGNALFVNGDAVTMFGQFMSNCAVAGVPVDWQLADGSRSLVGHAGAPPGYAVYFDKDLADGERFRCNNIRDGKDIYVGTTSGLLVKVVHEAIPSGIVVNFDDGAVALTNRFNADFTGAGDAGDKYSATDDERVQYGMVAAGTNAAEATHTHAIAAGATGVTNDNESTHTHTVPANTDAESAHTHSITPATDHAHDVGV